MSDDGPQSTGETLSKQPVDTSNPTDGKQTTPRQNAADPEFEMELERIRLDAKYERDRKRTPGETRRRFPLKMKLALPAQNLAPPLKRPPRRQRRPAPGMPKTGR